MKQHRQAVSVRLIRKLAESRHNETVEVLRRNQQIPLRTEVISEKINVYFVAAFPEKDFIGLQEKIHDMFGHSLHHRRIRIELDEVILNPEIVVHHMEEIPPHA